MISSLRWALALLFFGGALVCAAAQDGPAQRQHVKIAFVEIDNDPRYEPVRAVPMRSTRSGMTSRSRRAD
jgi:hypothetical protein